MEEEEEKLDNKKNKENEIKELKESSKDVEVNYCEINEELNLSNYDEKLDMEESKTLEYYVIFVGDSGVGKTSILNRFIDEKFENDIKCTINIDFKTKSLKIDKNLFAKLNIYDTAGQEKFRTLTRQYYHNADGVILVFDLTSENSFNKLNKWINEIEENTKNIEIILVGNKSDLQDRKINKINAEKFAKEKNLKYIETSAKEGTNILLLFEELSIGMNKRKNDDSSSMPELGSVSMTYIARRTELNKELKRQKEAKCC